MDRKRQKPPAGPHYYAFDQNNSGGYWTDNQQVAPYVFVQATSFTEANALAEQHGIYFDGCRHGMDCSCCGDRWSPAYSEDYATDVPQIYGQPLAEYVRLQLSKTRGALSHRNVIVYMLDGTKVRIEFDEVSVRILVNEQDVILGGARLPAPFEQLDIRSFIGPVPRDPLGLP